MTKIYFIIGLLLAVLFGYGIYNLYFESKIDNYCEKDNDKEECRCFIKYILNNISSENRHVVLEGIDKGYIEPNTELLLLGFQSYSVCAK